MSKYDETKQIYKTLSYQFASNLLATKHHYDPFVSDSRKKSWNDYSELTQLQIFISHCSQHGIPNDWYQWAIKRINSIDVSHEYLSD